MSRRYTDRTLGGVANLLEAVCECADRVGDWTTEARTSVTQAQRRLRIARRTATTEELLSWTADELGELGEVYLKDLILKELADRRCVQREAEALIREAFPAESDADTAALTRLLAELRKDEGDSADGGEQR
jgi:hypothetical protein